MIRQQHQRYRLFRKAVVLPQEHGMWAFLLSPLLIGLYLGQNFSLATVFLVIGVLDAFFLRQPIVVLSKVLAGRKPRSLLPVALFWTVIYGFIGILILGWFIHQRMYYVLLLALPALFVFAWHLYLVWHRTERGQMGIEIVASGTLALAAPAALWTAQGYPDPIGWLLWLLLWLQSSASIVYAYLRLQQRRWRASLSIEKRLRMGWRSLLYTTFNMVIVGLLGLFAVVSPCLWLAYAIQWAETVWGVFRPAIGWRPTRIGLRQFGVSTLFTIAFLLTW